jgi:hypothetical protein
VTTNSPLQAQLHQSTLRHSLPRQSLRYIVLLLQSAVIWRLSVVGFWPLAILVVLVLELRADLRRPKVTTFVHATPQLLAGVAAVLMIAVYPRVISQAMVGIGYFGWRLWLDQYTKRSADRNLVTTLIGQAIVFESIFLTAAIWNVPKIVVLAMVWLAAFSGAYHLLTSRQERTAAVLAAAWALIATEVAWVTLSWLVSYTILSGYVIIPQPAIILTVLAYSFGSIYLAQRQNQLGKKRLTEYLIIGLIIILIVIGGTNWKGSL